MNKIVYLTIVFILFCSKALFAQAPAWGGGADQNDISFGFTFQYVSSYFKIDKKNRIVETIAVIHTSRNPKIWEQKIDE